MGAFARATQRVPELTRKAIWLFGLIFFVVIAACATSNLIGKALAARTPAGMLATAFVLVVVAGIIAVGFLGRGPLRLHPLATGLAVLLVTRLIAVIVIPTPLISDFLRYHNLAIEVASRGPMWDLVPIGWPVVLGTAYSVLGTNPMVGELLNVALAFVTGYLVYDVGLHAFGRRAGALGLWLFTVAPAQIIYVVALGSEALYGTLIVAAVWVVVRLGWGRVLTGVAAGALLGASQYVRATTPALNSCVRPCGLPGADPAARRRSGCRGARGVVPARSRARHPPQRGDAGGAVGVHFQLRRLDRARRHGSERERQVQRPPPGGGGRRQDGLARL